MYHKEPPTDKTIREWYMNSSRVAACSFRSAVVAQSSSEILEGLMNNPVYLKWKQLSYAVMPAAMAAPAPPFYPINKQFSGVTNSYSEIISEHLQRLQMLAEATNLYLDHTTNKMYHNPAYAANASSYYAHILSAIKNT
jgi:hypothetical protein